MERISISSGAPWENIVGYCRAVKLGNVVEVSGTAPVINGNTAFPNDMYSQARLCLEIIEKALNQAGAELKDVIRTRIYVTDISKWGEAGKAHGEFFANIKPATTMVEVKALIDPQMMIEIEATAIISN
jgi:enamine deaminase RidA (YjgF/YER057c/UK114 family)